MSFTEFTAEAHQIGYRIAWPSHTQHQTLTAGEHTAVRFRCMATTLGRRVPAVSSAERAEGTPEAQIGRGKKD